MWHFFDKINVLNLPSAADRWRQTVSELQRVGCNNFTRFEALPDIGPHQSFNRSMHTMLARFYFGGGQNLLILEDDVKFADLRPLEAALGQLPEDWDILYLGANVAEKGFKMPLKHSPNLARVFDAWTTHAVAFNRGTALRRIIVDQPEYSARMFDNWLSSELHKYKAYCVTPMVAFQRPGNSYIWGGHTNYDPIFSNSDKILNALQ